MEILNNEISYFKDSDLKSNSMKINIENFVNKKSKICTCILDYNGKVFDNEQFLSVNKVPEESEENKNAIITSKLKELKDFLEKRQQQILSDVENHLKKCKIKEFSKK